MICIAAAVAGSGLRNAVTSLIFPSGRNSRWSVKLTDTQRRAHSRIDAICVGLSVLGAGGRESWGGSATLVG